VVEAFGCYVFLVSYLPDLSQEIVGVVNGLQAQSGNVLHQPAQLPLLVVAVPALAPAGAFGIRYGSRHKRLTTIGALHRLIVGGAGPVLTGARSRQATVSSRTFQQGAFGRGIRSATRSGQVLPRFHGSAVAIVMGVGIPSIGALFGILGEANLPVVAVSILTAARIRLCLILWTFFLF
jgi:hypothetical protein